MSNGASQTEPVCWEGWAVERPSQPLYVQFGGTEDTAWRYALGWPDAEEIAWNKQRGARAFRIQIKEIQ